MNWSPSFVCRQLAADRRRLALFTASSCALFFATYVINENKCHMGENLTDLLDFTVRSLSSASIPYWLDYGTLLGAIRDHSVVPWEFDLDIGVMEESCEAVLGLKDKFAAAKQFKVYGPLDYIAAKENWLLGYDGYIHTPCVRIYDDTEQYYVDVYWYRKFEAKQVLITEQDEREAKAAVEAERAAQGQQLQPSDRYRYTRFQPPSTWSVESGEALYCDDEAWEAGVRGGCKPESHLFPLTTIELLGQEMSIPAQSEAILTENYGDWRTPAPKGYKALLCLWLPESPIIKYMCFWIGVAGIAAIALWPQIKQQWHTSRGSGAGAGAGPAGIGMKEYKYQPVAL